MERENGWKNPAGVQGLSAVPSLDSLNGLWVDLVSSGSYSPCGIGDQWNFRPLCPSPFTSVEDSPSISHSVSFLGGGLRPRPQCPDCRQHLLCSQSGPLGLGSGSVTLPHPSGTPRHFEFDLHNLNSMRHFGKQTNKKLYP